MAHKKNRYYFLVDEAELAKFPNLKPLEGKVVVEAPSCPRARAWKDFLGGVILCDKFDEEK